MTIFLTLCRISFLRSLVWSLPRISFLGSLVWSLPSLKIHVKIWFPLHAIIISEINYFSFIPCFTGKTFDVHLNVYLIVSFAHFPHWMIILILSFLNFKSFICKWHQSFHLSRSTSLLILKMFLFLFFFYPSLLHSEIANLISLSLCDLSFW